VAKKYQPKIKVNYFAVLEMEKSLLKQHYSFLDCEIKNDTLYCYGLFKPPEYSITYLYRGNIIQS